MSSYYVSVGRGDDTTGSGTATSPWKTIAKAIGTSPAITLSGTGDTLYIEPGVYREAVALALSPATSGGRLTIVGDCDGAGFLAGGYTTPATGLVDWRAWTDDYTAGSSTAGIPISASSKNYVTLRNLKLIGGTTGGGGDCVQMATCAGWTIQDCNLISHYSAGNAIYATATAGVSLGLTIDRCNIKTLCPSSAAGVWLSIPKSSADWSLDVAITNCFFGGAGEGIDTRITGSGSFVGGGIAVQSCTFDSLNRAVNAYVSSGAIVPASPMTIYGCLIVGGQGMTTSAVGQIVEDGNILACVNPRGNTTAGANSIVAACPSLDFGDGRLTGLPPRPYGCPSSVGVIGGFGNYGTTPSVDMLGRNRPEGLGATTAASGCLERHDTGAQDATHQDTGSAACMALVGPSSQDRPVLLAAASTTISVKVRWDGNHGDTNKPQAILLPNPEIGFAGQTLTATSTGGSGSTPNSFETLTFTAFTPSKVGVVMLRMVSRAGAGNGVAYFDTIGIA